MGMRAVRRRSLSFPWLVCGDILMAIKGRHFQSARRPERAPRYADPRRLEHFLKRKHRAGARCAGDDGDGVDDLGPMEGPLAISF